MATCHGQSRDRVQHGAVLTCEGHVLRVHLIPDLLSRALSLLSEGVESGCELRIPLTRSHVLGGEGGVHCASRAVAHGKRNLIKGGAHSVDGGEGGRHAVTAWGCTSSIAKYRLANGNGRRRGSPAILPRGPHLDRLALGHGGRAGKAHGGEGGHASLPEGLLFAKGRGDGAAWDGREGGRIARALLRIFTHALPHGLEASYGVISGAVCRSGSLGHRRLRRGAKGCSGGLASGIDEV
mmetsp:Transcript_22693/g.61462  ORF Transcript_22693/g.61462 Transcript_22693/m.61462 type:complete len:238 (-) Transcript_22693:2612-3325(-)